MSSKTTKIAVGAVAFVAVAGFVGFGLWKASQPAPEVFQGQIEAQEADIAPKVTARIAQILVKEGDQIAVGAPLIRMDSHEVKAKLASLGLALKDSPPGFDPSAIGGYDDFHFGGDDDDLSFAEDEQL